MKIKNDIENWRNEVNELTKNVERILAEVKALNTQTKTMLKTTEKVASSLLALLRQQMGD